MPSYSNLVARATLVFALLAGAAAPSVAQLAREQVDGVTNFGRVTDTYFRGGKVTPTGVENLYKLGVRTIIDLRDTPDPAEPEAAARLGIEYRNFGLDGHATPDSKTIDEILTLIKDADAPVYVHCSAGKHRAGTVCALYRMKVQGWSPERAWAEQQSYGFGAREEHAELYAFAYDGGYVPAAAVTSDVIARASAASRVEGAETASLRVAAPRSAAAVATATSLSPSAAYLPIADVLAKAKAQGAAGDVLKIDLEYDLDRSIPTWDVTFSSGLEYEFHAVTGEFIGAKEKSPAKIAKMSPLRPALGDFQRVMSAAIAKGGQPVQEMELKHVKGTSKTIFEVVMVDGTTHVFDAETGLEIAGA